MRWLDIPLSTGEISDPILAGLRWWVSQLAELIPKRLRESLPKPHEGVFVDLMATSVVVSRQSKGHQAEITRLTYDESGSVVTADPAMAGIMNLVGPRREVTIRVPSEKILRKSFRLPFAAKRRLRPILAYEIERHTPMSAAEVLYDYAVISRDRNAGTLTAEVAIIKRDLAAQVLRILSSLGLSAKGVAAIDEDGPPQRLYHLLQEPAISKVKSLERNLTLGLAGAAVLLAISAGGVWIWQRQRTADLFEAHYTQLRKRSLEAGRLHKDITSATDQITTLKRLKERPQLAQIIAETSRLLPDDTWLFGFEMDGSKIKIQGLSPAASKLIAQFDSSSLFSNAQFAAPVTQATPSDLERFDLSFDVREGGDIK